MARPSRVERDEDAAHLAAGLTAYAVGVEVGALMAPGRGPPETAFARQLAMYLTHVSFAISFARVAAAFARDRSTVAYACRKVEDERDDPATDEWIDSLEAVLREAPPPRSAPKRMGAAR